MFGIHKLPQTHIPQIQQQLHTSQSLLSPSASLKQCCKFSRRDLAIRSNSLFLFLLGFQALNPSKAKAQEILEEINTNDRLEDTSTTEAQEILEENKTNDPPEDTSTTNAAAGNDTDSCSDKSITKKAFIDVSIDGEPVGRILIGLYGNDVPIGAARFGDLVSGRAGISYRRKEFTKIMPNYVQHGGVRSYGVDAEFAQRSGSNLGSQNLVEEWSRANEKCPGIKNVAGTVSIIVRDPLRPPSKLKLVAKQGKLEIDEEEVRPAPNGTEFVISVKNAAELDDSALVVGRVLQGTDVVERISQVKTVKENTTSPYFRVAKLIGDKRAIVAERGFNRPYSKVLITNCGLIEE